jgi:GT2 family glycosyltransferase
MMVRPSYTYTVTIVIVSFNTRELLRRCLDELLAECRRLGTGPKGEPHTAEILVVDNASHDGSAEMVERDYATTATPVKLYASPENLGFGRANNVAIEAAQGRYIVLLNSDAFFHEGALEAAIQQMEQNRKAGAGGAKLVFEDGSWQPSARTFHSIGRDALVLTGMASRFPRSRIFGSPDRTWADVNQPAQVDWVTGAFMILRREALALVGIFDPAFFLYCEEVDLCKRLKQGGFEVWYWPQIVVTHLGGESSKNVKERTFSKISATVEEWRMRSTLIYYRKHHGWQAHLARLLEDVFYTVRGWRNRLSKLEWRQQRAEEAKLMIQLMRQAWASTDGGRISPRKPW